MKALRENFVWSLGGTLVLAGILSVRAAQEPVPALLPDISFQNEVQHAIDRGLEWLRTHQHPEGYWSTPDHPAVTALAVSAFEGDPAGRYRKPRPAWLQKAYDYILSCVRPDGGIHRGQLPTYNTAISMMALLAANDPKFEPVILKARRFLISLQTDFGEKGKVDNVFDGGIGYGSKYPHSDMGNTLAALEALYYSKQLVKDRPEEAATDLNWEAAIHFLQNCQNLPEYNKQPWVSGDPKNRGGFVYYPGLSKAGAETNAVTGRVALRSYGSISYAGLLSYIYADLERDDPRVVAVYDWLRRNYTLDENPGMGLQGLFYYYHTMTKALTAYQVRKLTLVQGGSVDWRKELAMRLLNAQKPDGSWVNQNARWWENDPALVTSYVVLALNMIHRGL